MLPISKFSSSSHNKSPTLTISHMSFTEFNTLLTKSNNVVAVTKKPHNVEALVVN